MGEWRRRTARDKRRIDKKIYNGNFGARNKYRNDAEYEITDAGGGI